MAILVLGLVIFLGLHSIRIVSESGRERAIARFGEGPWKGIYSALSAIGFVLIVWGFARARYDAPQLWTPPPGARHITMLADAGRADSARGLSLQAEPYRGHRSIIRCCGRCCCGAQATSSPTARRRISCCSAPSSSGRPPIS